MPRMALLSKARIERLLIALAVLCTTCPAHSATIQERSFVVRGWHEWYDLKVDPEDAKNLMVCGNGWDSPRNALYGFVVVSHDGGASWHSTLDHRATTWVSEQSCAFGPNHLAYFISEASLVIDGMAHHAQGTTQLFVSTDAGEHWRDTTNTAWTDYSTSAVSSSSRELVAFYNSGGTRDPGRGWGTTIAALIFSRDGKHARGSFSDPSMKERDYVGNVPSQATALDDNSVVGLYAAARDTNQGREYELGLQRIDAGSGAMRYSKITTSNGRCFSLDGHALGYDKRGKQILVAYSAESATGCGIAIARSSDLGRTWTKQALTMDQVISQRGVDHLGMAISQNGTVGLLWEDGGKWLFSTIQGTRLSSPPLELSARPVPTLPDNDSLMTYVVQPQQFESRDSSPRAVVSVRSRPAGVMRCNALVEVGDGFVAIVPVIKEGYEALEATRISVGATQKPGKTAETGERDVTADVVLLWGYAQSFDPATGILNIDLRLGNRGAYALRPPIRLQARELNSDAGTVTIVNADNGETGPGAIWDISHSIVGDELQPGNTSYSTFRLAFHVALKPNGVPTYNFLDLGLNVLASNVAKKNPIGR